jgi:hypothetical protein
MFCVGRGDRFGPRGRERHPLSSQKTKSIERESSSSTLAQSPPAEVTDRLAALLPGEELERAPEGLEPEQITGPGGLFSQLAGRVIETALGAELSDHQGYEPGQGPPGGAGNHRAARRRRPYA